MRKTEEHATSRLPRIFPDPFAPIVESPSPNNQARSPSSTKHFTEADPEELPFVHTADNAPLGNDDTSFFVPGSDNARNGNGNSSVMEYSSPLVATGDAQNGITSSSAHAVVVTANGNADATPSESLLPAANVELNAGLHMDDGHAELSVTESEAAERDYRNELYRPQQTPSDIRADFSGTYSTGYVGDSDN